MNQDQPTRRERVVVDSTFILELVTHQGIRGNWCRHAMEGFIRSNALIMTPVGTVEDALHRLRVRIRGGTAIPGTHPTRDVEHVNTQTYFEMAYRIGTIPLAHPANVAEFLRRTMALSIEHQQLSINGLLACAIAERINLPLFTCNELLVMQLRGGRKPPRIKFRSPAEDTARAAINRAQQRGGGPEL